MDKVRALITILVICGIGYRAYNRATKPSQPKYDGTDQVVSFADDDKKMNEAMAKAKQTAPEFLAALKSPKPSQAAFSFKQPITDSNGTEHFWITDVSFDGATLKGKIGNDPGIVKNVKFGDPTTCSPAEISDWMYIEDGKLVGGFTIRAMRDALSPEDRKAMDADVPFKIE